MIRKIASLCVASLLSVSLAGCFTPNGGGGVPVISVPPAPAPAPAPGPSRPPAAWVQQVLSLAQFACHIEPIAATIANLWLASAGATPEFIVEQICKVVNNQTPARRLLTSRRGAKPVLDYGPLVINGQSIDLLVTPK